MWYENKTTLVENESTACWERIDERIKMRERVGEAHKKKDETIPLKQKKWGKYIREKLYDFHQVEKKIEGI